VMSAVADMSGVMSVHFFISATHSISPPFLPID
jgi:hypothetical protein